jgi:uncharacterized protein YicC (UPF0701 family)
MMGSDGGSRPVPDPTVLTTAALQREIGGVRESIGALKELTESDLEGLEAVVAERFNTVSTQFGLIERQRVEQKLDTGNALAAALAAAKEAVTKTEAATKEQIAQLKATIDTALGGLTTLVDDLRERVGRIEAIKQGGQEQKVESRTSTASLLTLASVIIGALGLIIAASIWAGSKP